MGYDSFLYNVVLMVHILAAIVGFGSSFVWPVLAAKARKLEPKQTYTVTHLGYETGKQMTAIPIYAAGATGLLLVIISVAEADWPITFSQTWISVAFTLFLIALGVSLFLHAPNLKAMDELGAKLAAGDVTPSPNGPPAEVLEMQERGKQAGMYGGILHLLFLLLLIDMVWKPGFGT